MRQLSLCLALLLAAPSLAAQSGWTVRSAPAVEFWYHAMAIVGLQGFGALPLYDPGYPAAVRAARDARGVAPTALERQAGDLRAALAADSAFEVMHFVPLYAATTTPDQLLATNAPGLLASVLGIRERPAVLERFLAAARSDLERAWSTERRDRAPELNAALAAVEQRWSGSVGPALAGYLTQNGLTGGIILPIPGLGPDGRFLAATRESPAVVAVQLPRDRAHAGDAAFFAVRELCYPAVRRALAAPGLAPPDRVAAELLSGRAAVRCGALLLDQAGPALGGAYREAFLKASGSRDVFETAFPVSGEVLAALRASLAIQR